MGVFGDLPTRLLTHALRAVPWFLEPALIAGWTFLFFLLAGPQRRSVAANLRALHPHWGACRGVLGAWRVFWNFAVTLVDAMRCNTAPAMWIGRSRGWATWRNSRTGRKVASFSAHMGNYDIAAPMFDSRFKRTLYTVRAPEREPETQRIREEEIRRKERQYPNFRSLYNRDGTCWGWNSHACLAKATSWPCRETG